MKIGKYSFEKGIIALHFRENTQVFPLAISEEAWRTRCASFIPWRRCRFTVIRQMAPLPGWLGAAVQHVAIAAVWLYVYVSARDCRRVVVLYARDRLLCLSGSLSLHGRQTHGTVPFPRHLQTSFLHVQHTVVHGSILCDPVQPNPSLTDRTQPDPLQVKKFGPNPTKSNITNNGAYSLVVTYFIQRTYLVLLVNRASLWSVIG